MILRKMPLLNQDAMPKMNRKFKSYSTMLCLLPAVSCATTSTTSTVAALPPAEIIASQEASSLTTSTGDILGTLQLPAARAPVPVVLLIAGSGPTDRDGNSPALAGKNNSLRMLAEGLASKGIASLRYDKRGIAASKSAAGREEDLRFTNYIDDAVAWTRKLAADARFSTVSLAGHSEGSLIGMIAAREAAADGFISIAGAGRRPADIIIEQLTGQVPPDLLAQSQKVLDQLSRGETPTGVPPALFALFRPSVQPYMISWFKFDPVAEIAKLTIPALIIQGTTDLQITEKDAKLLSAAYPTARYVAIEGMNHVFKSAPMDRSAQMKTYSDSTIGVVPQLVDEIATFVGTVRKPIAIHRAAPFIGPDKVKHFFISAFVTSVGFGSLQAMGAGRDAAVAGALASSAAAGFGREIHDRRTKGDFSIADLVWDAAGTGAAFLVINQVQR